MKILFKIWPDTPKQFVEDLRTLVMRNLAPDSTTAFCRIIELEPRLTTQHLRELNDYLAREEARKHIRFVNAENDSWGSSRAFGKMSLSDIPTVAQYWAGHFQG